MVKKKMVKIKSIKIKVIKFKDIKVKVIQIQKIKLKVIGNMISYWFGNQQSRNIQISNNAL